MEGSNIIEMMSVLAEPTRIKILEIISADGEKCAKDILPVFQITQPTLSHHLNLLLENNILSARKDGRYVYYSINREAVSQLRMLIDSFLEPPVVGKVKTASAPAAKSRKASPVLKKSGSVPEPKIVIASPDLDELKKGKKKKKSEKKKKDKDNKKKKK